MTNLQRIQNLNDPEEMTKAIYHAVAMSTYYTDSRRGMVKWLNETVWDPYKEAAEKLRSMI